MRWFALGLIGFSVFSARAHSAPSDAVEHLGAVNFAVSCAESVRAPFNRGVALLHDFWYDEAERQFKKIAATDPGCAMAHWGIVLSSWYQIWDRPDDKTLTDGWTELQKANSPPAATERERAYIAAASRFFRPGKEDFMSRVRAYSAAMGELYRRYPDDIDAGALYALSLLAAESPDDTSNAEKRKALAVLEPLFAKFPDNPGLDHYIIHACDTPSLAQRGLAASRHYSEIAYTGAHAVHMPGHIYARLGMWPDDIRVNLASVAASQAALARHQSDGMDQFHSDDFLLYAYLQSGQETRAKDIVTDTAALIAHYKTMPDMGSPFMRSRLSYFETEFPMFYALEMRDWQSAAKLAPQADAPPEIQTLTYWGRVIALGHLRQPAAARAALAKHDELKEQLKHGKYADFADSASARISHGVLSAWVAFADSRDADALKSMREAADLQDKVGQGEVDIPAREMLADMLLETHQPQLALLEYQRSLELSPNRFNGLYHAGMAAEAAGNSAAAGRFYAALLRSTDNGVNSTRPELEHVRSFVSSGKVASE
jgi:tetratricopeptide (TPR) repeat protein